MKSLVLILFEPEMGGNFIPFEEFEDKHLLPMGLEMTQEERRLFKLLEEEARERLRRKRFLSYWVRLQKIQRGIEKSLLKRRRRKEVVNN